jgi:hypothetical protein
MDNPIKTEKKESQEKEEKSIAIKFRFFLPPEVEVLLRGLILTSIIVGNLPNC